MGQKGKQRNSSRSILFIVRKNLYSPFISDSRERFFIWSQFSPTKPITVNWYFEPSSPTSFRRHSPDGGFRVSIRTPSASPLLVQDMIVPCLETVVSVNWNTISYCAYIRIISNERWIHYFPNVDDRIDQFAGERNVRERTFGRN